MSELPRTYQRFQAEYGELAAANQSESAVRSHTHRALEAGATAEEIHHALLLGITTIGFPAMMAALSWAQAAVEAHQG
jgi:AhpD family alkylhydroperoxidase